MDPEMIGFRDVKLKVMFNLLGIFLFFLYILSIKLNNTLIFHQVIFNT